MLRGITRLLNAYRQARPRGARLPQRVRIGGATGHFTGRVLRDSARLRRLGLVAWPKKLRVAFLYRKTAWPLLSGGNSSGGGAPYPDHRDVVSHRAG